jgi:hypothetical protein
MWGCTYSRAGTNSEGDVASSVFSFSLSAFLLIRLGGGSVFGSSSSRFLFHQLGLERLGLNKPLVVLLAVFAEESMETFFEDLSGGEGVCERDALGV